MKILMLNHNIKGEGTYFRAFNYAANLGRGHDITLMCVSEESYFFPVFKIIDGIKVIECPRLLDVGRGGWAPLDILFRLFFVLFNRFEIIHAFDHKPNVYFPALLAKRMNKKAVLISDWADWWGKGGINGHKKKIKIIIEEKLEEKIRLKADFVTATSIALRDRALSIGVKSDRIFYMPSGCDTEKIKPVDASEKLRIRKQLGIKEKGKVLMFIGFGQGDLGIVFDAFKTIRKNEKNAFFYIIGPLEEKHKETYENHLYKESIVITGKVDIKKVALYAAAADVFVMPLSDTKANRGRGPMKIGDYMAAGKPIIANPVGDIKEWIKKYKIGLSTEYNGRDVAKKALKLFNNTKLREKTGNNARTAAEKVFSWKIMGKKMNDIYRKARLKTNHI